MTGRVETRGLSALSALIAGGLPLLLLSATASAYPDGAAELPASMQRDPLLPYGVPAPLGDALTRLLMLLPLGPISLRASFASAIAIALAAVAVQRAAAGDSDSASGSGVRSGCSIGAAWLFAGCPPVFALGTGQGSVAVALALGCFAIERAHSARGLRGACSSLGLLGLCAVDAPALALISAAIALPLLGRAFARAAPESREPLLRAAALLAAASCAAVAARVLPSADPERAIATVLWPRETVAAAIALGLACAASIAARLLLWALSPRGRPGMLQRASVLLWLLMAAALAHHSALDALDIAHADSDLLHDHLLRDQPARALLLLQPDTARHLASIQLEEASRPDLEAAPLPLLGDATMAPLLAERLPQLSALCRETLLAGELSLSALQSLASQRPLSLEPTTAIPQAVRESLRPVGPLFAVSTSALTTPDLELAIEEQRAWRIGLASHVDRARLPARASRFLAYRQLVEAYIYAVSGQIEPARSTLQDTSELYSGGDPLQLLDDPRELPSARATLQATRNATD